MVGTSRFGKPSIDLKMLVLIVEEISFPAGGTYALKRSFIDYEVNNNKKIKENLKKWFYVDDLLQSVHNVEKAKVLLMKQ